MCAIMSSDRAGRSLVRGGALLASARDAAAPESAAALTATQAEAAGRGRGRESETRRRF